MGGGSPSRVARATFGQAIGTQFSVASVHRLPPSA
jgi:hypothetical protein